MKKSFSVLFVTLLSGCAILNEENVTGFGEIEVKSYNSRPFPVGVYVNGQPIKKELVTGDYARYVQLWHDTNDLLIEVYSGEQLVTNKLIKGTSRSIGDDPRQYVFSVR